MRYLNRFSHLKIQLQPVINELSYVHTIHTYLQANIVQFNHREAQPQTRHIFSHAPLLHTKYIQILPTYLPMSHILKSSPRYYHLCHCVYLSGVLGVLNGFHTFYLYTFSSYLLRVSLCYKLKCI